MSRDEKENLRVAIILASLIGFVAGLFVAATVVDRLQAKAERAMAADFVMDN